MVSFVHGSDTTYVIVDVPSWKMPRTSGRCSCCCCFDDDDDNDMVLQEVLLMVLVYSMQ